MNARRVLLTITAALALAAPATSDAHVLPAGMQHTSLARDVTHMTRVQRSLDVARTFWGGQPSDCPNGVRVYAEDLPVGTAGLTDPIPGACRIWIDAVVLDIKDPVFRAAQCDTIVHEIGHAKLGQAFAAVNPADPWHSLAPRSILTQDPLPHTTVRGCYHAFIPRRARHDFIAQHGAPRWAVRP